MDVVDCISGVLLDEVATPSRIPSHNDDEAAAEENDRADAAASGYGHDGKTPKASKSTSTIVVSDDLKDDALRNELVDKLVGQRISYADAARFVALYSLEDISLWADSGDLANPGMRNAAAFLTSMLQRGEKLSPKRVADREARLAAAQADYDAFKRRQARQEQEYARRRAEEKERETSLTDSERTAQKAKLDAFKMKWRELAGMPHSATV
ncbi:MAG: hypothetical protein ACXVAM_07540 [Vulcanimicrobiaceae bacterium]